MKNPQYRAMPPHELSRIGEVNRQEVVHAVFVPESDESGFGIIARLVEKEPPAKLPPWGAEGAASRAQAWEPILSGGGKLYGTFVDNRLVGFVLLGPKNADNSGEIAALFVDEAYRRLGVAGELLTWAEEQATALGMDSLYLYSNPTESAVKFYLNAGFGIVGLISKEIVPSLPGDVVMAKHLKRVDERSR